MQVTEITYKDATPVDGYGPGFFRVGGTVREGALLLTRTVSRGWGGLDDLGPLEALAGEVDVVILGTGQETRLAPKAMREALEPLGIGIEPMASPTACRSYNILLSEGRRVALAALPV